MESQNTQQSANTQQPTRYYDFPRSAEDKIQTDENSRFDRLRNAAPASSNNDAVMKTDVISSNQYQYDPSPALPPPHHNLESMNKDERKDWQHAHGNPNYNPNKDQALRKDSSNLALNNQGSGSGSLVKQDSATTIGGMKTDDYLHNISVDGSGVITSMKYNRQSPNGTLRHSPSGTSNNHNSGNRNTSSEFASLKPNHQRNDDLGVQKDSPATKIDDGAPIVGYGKAHEWAYDSSKNKEGSNKEMMAAKKVDFQTNDEYKENPAQMQHEEPQAKLEEQNSEKLGSANNDKVSSAAVIAGAPNAIAGAPNATAVAPLNHSEPAHDSSLLHSNKSGSSFHSPGGTHHSHDNKNKASVWEKITCRSGSKTKPGKHYVNPAGVVNHNQGLK